MTTGYLRRHLPDRRAIGTTFDQSRLPRRNRERASECKVQSPKLLFRDENRTFNNYDGTSERERERDGNGSKSAISREYPQ